MYILLEKEILQYHHHSCNMQKCNYFFELFLLHANLYFFVCSSEQNTGNHACCFLYITLFCVILIHSLTHLLLTTNAKQNNIFNVAEKHNKHTSHYLIISGTRFCLSLSLNSLFYAFFFNEMQNLHY